MGRAARGRLAMWWGATGSACHLGSPAPAPSDRLTDVYAPEPLRRPAGAITLCRGPESPLAPGLPLAQDEPGFQSRLTID